MPDGVEQINVRVPDLPGTSAYPWQLIVLVDVYVPGNVTVSVH